MSIGFTRQNQRFALLTCCLMLASSLSAVAQTQNPGGPAPQNPAPTPAPTGGTLPPGGCVYANQNYSNGARLPNGQTCTNGSWS